MTERFIIHPASIGSIIIDANTGLWWQTDYATNKTWQQAMDYAEELNKQEYAGYKDWRLPTIEELVTLINYKWFESASDFPEMPPIWFWSSSSYAYDTSYVWLVYGYDGSVCHYGKETGGTARCVRGGK